MKKSKRLKPEMKANRPAFAGIVTGTTKAAAVRTRSGFEAAPNVDEAIADAIRRSGVPKLGETWIFRVLAIDVQATWGYVPQTRTSVYVQYWRR